MSLVTTRTPLPDPLPERDEIGPLVGRHVGRYRVTGYLGEGPTGVVYRCDDPAGRPLALKALHRELGNPRAAAALASDLARLRVRGSRHALAPIDSGFTDEGQLYFVAPELRGVDLADRLAERGPLAPREALAVVREVCLGLEAAHAVGVVHGGLKPHNVFLLRREDQRVGAWDHAVVLDFACARLADGGLVVGHPQYLAPEQFAGAADARSDVYAVGLLIHEIFAGAPPFVGAAQAVLQKLADAPPPLAGVAPELRAMVARALSRAPAARYQSVRALREALERFAATAELAEAAAFHVIHHARGRAVEARVEAGALAPDATAPMPKSEVMELAEVTKRPTLGASPPPPPEGQNGTSSDSVEASLEDFISQANKSFQEPADGWTLNTDEVELVTEADLAPVQPAKIAAALKAPPVIAREAKQTKVGVPVTVPEKTPTPTETPAVAQRPSTAADVAAAAQPTIQADAPVLPAATAAAGGEAAALATAATVSAPAIVAPVAAAPTAAVPAPAPAREPSQPIPTQTMPATASAPIAAPPARTSPLLLVGVILGAFVLGSVAMAVVIKFLVLGPSAATTPTVTVAPPPAVAPIAPAPTVTPVAPTVTPVAPPPVATAPAPAPVVTPLPTAPVVTPLPAAAPPPETAPVATAPVEAKKTKHAAGAKHEKPAAAPKEKPAAPKAEKPAAAPKEKPAAAPKEKPAAPAAPKKEKKDDKGGGWVDPFG